MAAVDDEEVPPSEEAEYDEDDEPIYPKRRWLYRCCCCAHIKDATLIFAYIRLAAMILCAVPLLILTSHWPTAVTALVLILITVLTIVGAHVNSSCIMLLCAILETIIALLTVIIVAFVFILVDPSENENYRLVADVYRYSHNMTTIERAMKQAKLEVEPTRIRNVLFYSNLGFEVLILLLEIWFLTIVWRCFFYLLQRHKWLGHMRRQRERQRKQMDEQEQMAAVVKNGQLTAVYTVDAPAAQPRHDTDASTPPPLPATSPPHEFPLSFPYRATDQHPDLVAKGYTLVYQKR